MGLWSRAVCARGGDRTARRILATGASVTVALVALAGGLALVVASLHPTTLRLNLRLDRRGPDRGRRRFSPGRSLAGKKSHGPERVGESWP